MLASQKFITLAIVVGHCLDRQILAAISRDLGIENQPLVVPDIKSTIMIKSRPRKELCLNCLQPTIYGHSYELQVGCPQCGPADKGYLWQLGHQLGIELEGEDRKVLMQFIYQSLEDIGVINV